MDEGQPGGGSGRLGELIDLYGDYLICDLLETYGVDLRDVFRDGTGVSPKFVVNLIYNLPDTSRFEAERQGGQQFHGWGYDRYAAVATVNALRGLQWTLVAVNSKSKPKQPEPFPTPKKKNSGPAALTPGSFAAVAASKLYGEKAQ